MTQLFQEDPETQEPVTTEGEEDAEGVEEETPADEDKEEEKEVADAETPETV